MQECNTTAQQQCKNVDPLVTCTKEEKRLSSILSSQGVKPTEIHRRMNVQCGDACLSLQQVYEWTRKSMNGISSVTDSPRPGARVVALSAKEFCFSRDIHALPKRWNTCMKGNGDYIEKLSHSVPFVFNKLQDKNI